MGLSGFGHWIVILIIVLVLFGAGRVSGLMGELGKGIKSFKEGMGDDEEERRRRFEEQRRTEPPRLPSEQEPIDVAARPAESAAPPPKDDEAR